MIKNKLIKIFFVFLTSTGLVWTMTSCDMFGDKTGDVPIVTDGDLDKDTSFSFDLYINGTKETVNVADGEDYILQERIPVIEGYKFDGWYMDEAYTVPCKLTELRKENAIEKLYVKMVAITTAEIKVNCSDGNGYSYNLSIGSLINLNEFIPKITGKKFEGWYVDAEYTTELKETKIVVSEDLEIFALYSDLETYKVTVQVNGETFNFEKYADSTILVSDYIEVKDDYVFDGWYYDEEFTQKANDTIKVDKDLTLYVHYFEAKKTTVEILNNVDSHSTLFEDETVDLWFNLSEINTNRKNYKFDGWYTDATLETKITTNKIRITADMKLYMKYTELQTVTLQAVIPDKNGDYSITILDTCHIDDTISLKNIETVEIPSDLILEGWFLDESYVKELTNTEIKIDSFLNLNNEPERNVIKIYAKTSCEFEIYFSDNKLVTSKKFPYTQTLSFQDVVNMCGEDYKIETINEIPVDEVTLKSEIQINKYTAVTIAGKDYTNFVLKDEFEYSIIDSKNNYIAITKYKGNNSIVTIPSYIDDKKVTKINDYAFDNDLVSLTIPSSVTSISSKTFENCKKIIEIYNLSEVNINSKIAANIYNDSNTESKLFIYDNEFVIYENNGSYNLVSYLGIKPRLTLPTDINGQSYEIYKYAFYGNDKINTLIIPEGIKEINESAFANCYNLIRITLPTTLTTLKNDSFTNCFNLIEIYNASNIVINKGEMTNSGLGLYALEIYTDFNVGEYNNNFKEVIVETSGYKYEFLTYKYEEKLYLLGFNKTNSDVNVLKLPTSIEDSEYEIYHHAFYGNEELLTVVLPTGLSTIGNSAFENCINLKELTLNNDLKTIGNYSFNNCYKLNKVRIPGAVETIGIYAFANCSNLIELILEDGIKSIGSYAFSNLSSLLTLEIPNSVISIEEKALYKTSNLVELSIPFVGASRTSETYYYFGYIFGGESSDTEINIDIPTKLKTLHITDDETISNQAFWKCKNLTTVLFYETKKVEDSAFGYCSGLKTLSFPTNELFDFETDTFFQTSIATIILDDWNKLYSNDKYVNELFKYSSTTGELTTKVNTYTQVGEEMFSVTLTNDIYLSTDQFYGNEYLIEDVKLTIGDIEIGSELLNYTITSNIKTSNKDGFKYFAGGSEVIVTININGTNFKITKPIQVKIIPDSTEEGA